MTLVSTIIRDAYRESNLIAITAQPTEAERDEGLSLLNRLLASVFGTDAGEQLDGLVIGRNNIDRPSGYPWYEQVPDTTDWFVPANTRLFLNLTSAQTIWLSPNPIDGQRWAFIDKSANLATFPLTVEGNGRTIEGLTSKVYNTNSQLREFIYREDLGNWQVVTPLEADDEFPFPTEFDDKFIIELAARLNPRNAVATAAESTQRYIVVNRNFKARYRQSNEWGSELGLVRLPSMRRRFITDTRFGNATFDSGYPYPFGGRMRW